MKTDVVSLTKARELMDELAQLEEVMDVMDNYDVKSYALFSSVYNKNKEGAKEVKILMPAVASKPLIDYIHERIDEIKKQLAKL